MTVFEPPLRLTLDGSALVSNWRALDQRSGAARAGAAVKADAYGLGAREVVARLRDAGCRDFFVAHWGEAEAIAADRSERISGESTEESVIIRARRLEKGFADWDSPMLSAMALSPGVAACGKLVGTCDGTGSCGVGGSGAATQLQSS